MLSNAENASLSVFSSRESSEANVTLRQETENEKNEILVLKMNMNRIIIRFVDVIIIYEDGLINTNELVD